MSHPRRQHRTHTHTHRAHPKPRIRPTPTTRPPTTSPAVLSRRRNHLGVHSPIHQPNSYGSDDWGVEGDTTTAGYPTDPAPGMGEITRITRPYCSLLPRANPAHR
jgi:hypothetical protein